MTKSTSAQNVSDLSFEEKSILNGIIRGGREVFSECADLLKEDCFEGWVNKVVYGACSLIFDQNETFSGVTVLSKAKDLGLDDSTVFQAILDAPPSSLSDIREVASKLRKRKIIKEAISLHRGSIDKLSQMSATEDITKIFAVSESTLFDLISKFSSSSDQTILLSSVVKELVDYFEANPSENIGLPTPWPQFNKSIGGGMRTGVTLIGARSGIGKSVIAQITANYLGAQDIPVLILDTEMEYKDVLPRMLANLSNIPINNIETGSFGINSFSKLAVHNAVKQMEKMPIHYKSIAGKSFDEILSIIRRWVYKDVGLNKKGRANECLIIYDYFKIMDSSDINDMAEFQAMGFQISKLTDFCKMYDLPCMSFVQLNRDGVSKESTDVIAQSDRLLWLCNSFSLFKVKSGEEIESDGLMFGNRKMITLKSRYGGEHSYGEYISMQFKGDVCSLLEIPPKIQKIENNEQSEQPDQPI